MARPKGSRNKNRQVEAEVLNLQGTEVKEDDLRASIINPIIGEDIMNPDHTVLKDEEKPGSYIFMTDSVSTSNEGFTEEESSSNTVGFSIQDDPAFEVLNEVPEVAPKVNANNAFNRDSSVGKNSATIDGGEFYNFFD